MKKIIFTFFMLCICILSIDAKSISVKFSSCVDGDTAKFIYKKEVITARFLAIDTPETKHPNKGVQPFGKEASEYTCNKLTNAKNIKLEFDEDSDEKDKYDRYLVWVFVDDELLQKKLVNKGLASVAYLYGDYKYTDELEKVEQEAEDQKLGIWSLTEEERSKPIDDDENLDKEVSEESSKNDNDQIDYKEIIILVGALIIVCTFSSKARTKVKNEASKELRKKLKNEINKKLK